VRPRQLVDEVLLALHLGHHRGCVAVALGEVLALALHLGVQASQFLAQGVPLRAPVALLTPPRVGGILREGGGGFV